MRHLPLTTAVMFGIPLANRSEFMKNDDLHRSGLAFGWLEETQPRRWSARPYWLATGAILALLAPVLAILIWWAS